ncbi:MAG: 30S ribosomal protein S4 [Acidobacteriota bacterium]
MARYTAAVCRLCRRENMKLFLKGARCFSDKCAIEKRAYPPGQHGKRRVKIIGYGHQLREKQKVKRIYGVLERQFRLYFKKAAGKKGVTGHTLLQSLERRLDSACVRLGFAPSQAGARQLVSHGHVRVNGRKVDVPSFQLRQGEVVELSEKMQKNLLVQESVATAAGRSIPDWLDWDAANFKATVKDLPNRDHVTLPIQEQLIVELYSK